MDRVEITRDGGTGAGGSVNGMTRAGLALIGNPDLDPGRDGADAIISYFTQAITASDQPAR